MTLSNDQACTHCGRWANRAVTIDAVIVQDRMILLILRGHEPFKGKWALPGGHVDWNETAEEAVKREVKEEAGLEVASLKFIGPYSDPKRHPEQAIDLAFVVEARGEVKAGDDAVECRWFALDELPEELAFDHGRIVGDYIQSKLK
jgi:8-oxo-dGTP diphosphatase